MDNGINKFDEVVGLLKRATIVNYIPNRGIIQVKLANGQQAVKGQNPLVPIDIAAPHGLFYNNGLFIGTLPNIGTPIIIGQGSGGQYHFVSFVAEDLSKVPALKLGELLIRSSEDSKITLSDKNDISIGSDLNRIHINTTANYLTSSFTNENHFTQGSRQITGVIKRDLIRNTKYDQNNKLDSDDYDPKFKIIGLDPSTTVNTFITGSSKNPPFIESRELIYEFQFNSDVDNDLKESIRYSNNKQQATNYLLPNRRKSRADTLSLSLVAPNYLMETTKGTVVDIFGNILDLNRYPLPVGKDQNTINASNTGDKTQAFLRIKELERKSLAFHFEINARKDLKGQTASDLINSSDDYARSRSRFFFDVDKEGLFKLNVPASSENGNIPLTTRYENYSTFGSEDNGNPNKLIFSGGGNSFDIYQDSFASPTLTPADGGFLPGADRGSISLQTGDGANAAPQDRLTGAHIKHGMVYHDILQTCFTHQNKQFIDYTTSAYASPSIFNIPVISDIVNKTITTSGDKANAGGRSGSMSLDGSLELNIGANTVDRQSLWLSTAGGMVQNIGRDINGRSLLTATGGDVYFQIGGFGITGDTRFVEQDNGIKGAVLDLRVLSSGRYCHIIRIDDNGITIMSPSNIAIHAKGALELTSDQSVRIDAPTVTIQQRLVLNAPMGTI